MRSMTEGVAANDKDSAPPPPPSRRFAAIHFPVNGGGKCSQIKHAAPCPTA